MASCHDRAQPTLIDLAHRERRDTGVAHVGDFRPIHIAQADNGDIARLDFWREAEEMRQFRRPFADAAGQRHAVYVAAR